MNINLDKYFDSQKPTITVFGKDYEVNNDYKKTLEFQAAAKTATDNEEDIVRVFHIALKPEDVAEILAHNFSFEFFSKLILGITAAMTGRTIEELEGQVGDFRKQQPKQPKHAK